MAKIRIRVRILCYSLKLGSSVRISVTGLFAVTAIHQTFATIAEYSQSAQICYFYDIRNQ